MQAEDVKNEQLEFFRRSKAGCTFAAQAAKNQPKYGWKSVILNVDGAEIASTITAAIDDESTKVLSMLFPSVVSTDSLLQLIDACVHSGAMVDEGETNDDFRFVRLRARVGDDLSWVSGFAPLNFLPATRQAPHCELTVRVKPRPEYDWYFKPPQPGVIHLADLEMRGMSDRHLERMWAVSFVRTKKIL